MKIVILLLIFSNPLFAQTDSSITVSCNKTTTIVFPNFVKTVDRGSKDILVQKPKGAENVLLVKAARENFTQTNLTIITADDKLYSFIVNYSPIPARLEIAVKDTRNIFETISAQKRTVHGVHDCSYDMLLRLVGLYIDNDLLYYQLEIQNRSNIPYDIDMLRFFIKDRRQGRRTASQEIEQHPLYIYGNTGAVSARSKQTIVVALPKFTIPDKKLFRVQVMEKNGGRHLRIRVNNNCIIKAIPLQL